MNDGDQQAQNNNKINSSLCRGSYCDVCCCCCHFLHLSVWLFIYDGAILAPQESPVKAKIVDFPVVFGHFLLPCNKLRPLSLYQPALSHGKAHGFCSANQIILPVRAAAPPRCPGCRTGCRSRCRRPGAGNSCSGPAFPAGGWSSEWTGRPPRRSRCGRSPRAWS